MKTPIATHLAIAASCLLTVVPATLMHAQATAVTTTTAADGAATSTSVQTTSAAGTIQEFTPGASRLIVRTTAGAPVTYAYSKRTTFVDAAGNTVSYETIKPGEPTTVYYTMEAGEPVVSKVVVNRTVTTAPVTATTTEVQPATVVTPAVPVTHTSTTETTTTTTGRK